MPRKIICSCVSCLNWDDMVVKVVFALDKLHVFVLKKVCSIRTMIKKYTFMDTLYKQY